MKSQYLLRRKMCLVRQRPGLPLLWLWNSRKALCLSIARASGTGTFGPRGADRWIIIADLSSSDQSLG